jgi:hypothetical protein
MLVNLNRSRIDSSNPVNMQNTTGGVFAFSLRLFESVGTSSFLTEILLQTHEVNQFRTIE